MAAGTAKDTGQGGRVVVPALPVTNDYRNPMPDPSGQPAAAPPNITMIGVEKIPAGPGTMGDMGGGAAIVASNTEGTGGVPEHGGS